MVADLNVRGTHELKRVGELMKDAPQDMRREMFRGINRATKEPRRQTLQELSERLPDAGGASAAIRKDTKLNTKRNMRGRNVGIRIIAKSPRTVQRMNNQGVLRHPLFGNRSRWFNQNVSGLQGWFDEPLQRSAPQVRQEILEALDRAVDKIASS